MRVRGRRASPQNRRQPLTLEQLEDRTLLSGDLLVTAEVPGAYNYNLMQYTQQGVLVNSQAIPKTPGATENQDARGLSIGPSGNVNVFDGTATPSLAVLSAGTPQAWSFRTAPGWSTNANVTYGSVAAYNNYLFASNMASYNGQSYGMVRFDSSGSPELFAPGASFVQITLGQDGLLYGLENSSTGPTLSQTVEVFNPDTLAFVRSFSLNSAQPIDFRSIAVDSSGNVFAASWGGTVAEYDSNGNPTGESIVLKTPSGFADNLVNIALDSDGQIAVGGHRGTIYLTNESLSSVQAIQTNQWNVFVTFDHYIGSAPQTVTPTFSALTGPTITYGQSSVTLGGQISAGSQYPPGSVSITVAGETESAAINPADGSFSATFNVGTLGVSTSPYTITYSYAAQQNYNAVTDTSQSLTVTQAITTLSGLASPTVVVGASSTTLSGTVGSNSVLPVGQSVTVTLIGANGPIAGGSGVIGSDGSFQATINTAAVPAGSYTIQYSYAGDSNFQASSGTGKLQVTYAVNTICHPSRPIHAGAALRLRLQVDDAAGNDLSSRNLTVTAVSLVGPNGQTYTPQAEGWAKLSDQFRHVGGGYRFNLDTKGLPAGKYTLFVQVGNDPVLHAISFVVAGDQRVHEHHERFGDWGDFPVSTFFQQFLEDFAEHFQRQEGH